MAAASSRPELLVIVGPTASGKSELAMKVAKKFDSEIICADSRTVYKGMDIGTAKPSKKDQKAVPHWGLDLLEPGQKFSAADFKKYAEVKIKETQSRHKLPIIVGGTGLYVDALLFDFSFVEPKKLPLPHRLFYPWYSNEKLQKMIAQRDWPMPENKNNRRYLINTIRRRGAVGARQNQPPPGTLLVGLMPADEVIKQRISARADAMFKLGIIGETRQLMQTYGPKTLGNSAGIIYKIVARVIKGDVTNDQAIKQFKTADWQYARRQKTWFKRNKFIKWFGSPAPAFDYINEVLNT